MKLVTLGNLTQSVSRTGRERVVMNPADSTTFALANSEYVCAQAVEAHVVRTPVTAVVLLFAAK